MATFPAVSGITVNGKSYSQSVSVDAGAVQVIDGETASAGATDVALAFSLDVSACKALYIHSTRAGTLKTNSSSTPDETLTLTADTPYLWYDGSGAALHFTTDISALYWTNSSTSYSSTIYVVAAYDPSP